MKSLLIFDWDDVFTLGSKEGYFACYKEAVISAGFEFTDEEIWHGIKQRWGQPHRQVLAGIIKDESKLLDQVCKTYERNLFGDLFMSRLTVIEGAVQLLEGLESVYKLAIATGMHGDLLKDRVMNRFRIPNVFSCIVSSYDLPDPNLSKPHPFMLQTILKQLHCEPDQAIMIGDAGSDVLMAQAAQVEPVVVLTGQLDEVGAEKLGVNYIIDDVTKIESILKLL